MKILVVDDQKANQIMLEGLLTGMGHSVVCVDNGQRALEVFNSVQPQIVLLDVMMPVLNGFETAPRLKELSGNIHLPIIFITALDAKDTLLRCLQVGGDDFLSVPFEPVVLQAKISAHGRVRELSYSLAQKNKTLNWHSNRMEREQSVVQHMLHNALRENELDKPYIKSYLRSVSTFNGDLCLGKEGPFGNYYLFLGDFTGHGLAPATGTLPLSQAFFGMASRGLSVSDMAAEFNQRLLNLLPDDMFCAALIIELSPGGERLTCWNGGIPDALVINSSGEVQHHIPSRHMALGILSTEDFDNQVEHLFVSQDHSVIAFTDGVVEMQLADKAMLGEAGFTQMVSNAWQRAPEQAFENVCQQLKQMMDANQQIHDDLSLVVLDCKRNAPVDSKQSTEHNHLPFTLSVTIGKREVEKLDPMQQLVDSLGKLEALKSHKTTLYLLFAECFNNILDHNVLQLDSDVKEALGFERYYVERQQRLRQNRDFAIQIDIHYTPVEERISFAISSNGECPYPMERASEQSHYNEQLFGRGLELVKNFADTVEWREQGRILFVDYDLSRPPA
jgi:CheY-like chemotaxis protein